MSAKSREMIFDPADELDVSLSLLAAVVAVVVVDVVALVVSAGPDDDDLLGPVLRQASKRRGREGCRDGSACGNGCLAPLHRGLTPACLTELWRASLWRCDEATHDPSPPRPTILVGAGRNGILRVAV